MTPLTFTGDQGAGRYADEAVRAEVHAALWRQGGAGDEQLRQGRRPLHHGAQGQRQRPHHAPRAEDGQGHGTVILGPGML